MFISFDKLFDRYALCKSIYNHLERDSRNVVLVHCMDGKASSACVVVALFLYTQLFRTVDEGLQMFAVKRSPPGLNASQYRYLNYYAGLVAEPPILPHRKPLTIATLTVSPVPLFTKQRDGCRPYVELFQGDQRIISTLTEYERMRVYHATEDKVLNMHIFRMCLSSIYLFIGLIRIWALHSKRIRIFSHLSHYLFSIFF